METLLTNLASNFSLEDTPEEVHLHERIMTCGTGDRDSLVEAQLAQVASLRPVLERAAEYAGSEAVAEAALGAFECLESYENALRAGTELSASYAELVAAQETLVLAGIELEQEFPMPVEAPYNLRVVREVLLRWREGLMGIEQARHYLDEIQETLVNAYESLPAPTAEVDELAEMLAFAYESGVDAIIFIQVGMEDGELNEPWRILCESFALIQQASDILEDDGDQSQGFIDPDWADQLAQAS